MSAKTPTVYDRWLEDPQIPGSSIRLDSLAWLAWLEAATTTRFAYPSMIRLADTSVAL